MKDYYRLTTIQKVNISQNLIDILEKDSCPSPETITFICNWILTDRSEKFKAYYDVWEMVLRNFYPQTRPLLIRSISRKSTHEYIASFTNSAYSAERFGKRKGYWIICDTKYSLISDFAVGKKGSYRNTFYPLSNVLKRAKEKAGWGFSERFLSNYSGEDEYIMKINFSYMHLLKYIEHTY
jgi:hypothetical protein